MPRSFICVISNCCILVSYRHSPRFIQRLPLFKCLKKIPTYLCQLSCSQTIPNCVVCDWKSLNCCGNSQSVLVDEHFTTHIQIVYEPSTTDLQTLYRTYIGCLAIVTQTKIYKQYWVNNREPFGDFCVKWLTVGTCDCLIIFKEVANNISVLKGRYQNIFHIICFDWAFSKLFRNQYMSKIN